MDEATPRSASLGEASAFALHSTGRFLAFGDKHGRVVLCTRAEGAFIEHSTLIEAGLSAVTVMRFDQAGERLAIARSDGSVEVWQAGDLLWRQAAFRCAVKCLAFGNRGRLLASGSALGLIRIHAGLKGHSLGVYNGHAGAVTGLQFLPDGEHFVSSGIDRTVRHWQVGRTGLRSLPLSRLLLGSMQAGRSGKLFAITHSPRTQTNRRSRQTLQVFDPKDPLHSQSMALERVRMDNLAISEKHRLAFTIHELGYLVRTDLDSGEVLEQLSDPQLGEGTRIDAFQMSRDEERIFLSMARGQLLVLEGGSNAPLSSWGDLQERCNLLCLSGDGRVLAASGERGTVTLLDTTNGKRITEFHLDTGLQGGLALNSDASQLAVSRPGGAGAIQLWSTRSQRMERTLIGIQSMAIGLAFHPSEPFLAAHSQDGMLVLWDTRDTPPIYSWNASNQALNPVFAPDGSWLAGAGEEGELQFLMSRSPAERKRSASYYPGFGSATDLPANQAALQSWILTSNPSAPPEAHQEARLLAEHARGLNPQDPYAHLALAQAQLRLGNPEAGLEALATLDALIAAGEWPARDQPTELLRSLLLASSGQPQAGLKVYERLIKLRPYPSGLNDSTEGRRPLAEEARSLFKTDGLAPVRIRKPWTGELRSTGVSRAGLDGPE